MPWVEVSCCLGHSSAEQNSGGLGVKDLELQNCCLLMKFIDKLFSSTDAPWKSWVLRDASAHDSGGFGGNSFI
jgi:hypothetical protein